MINEPNNIKKVNIPNILPVLPRNDIIVYPFLILPIAVIETRFIKLIDDALSSNKMVLLGYTKSNDLQKLNNNEIEEYGTVANILKMLRFPDGSVRILVQGMKRAKIKKFNKSFTNYPLAEIETINEMQRKTIEVEAMARNLMEMFRKYIKYSQQLPNEIFQILKTIEEPWKLADFISSNLTINIEQKYKILTFIDPMERMRFIADILTKEISILEVGEKIKSMVSTEINDDQKKYFLREQLRAIRKELGEDDPKEKEIEDIIKRAKKKKLSKEAKEILDEQMEKLGTMNPMMPDYNVIRTYIEWILDLPWNNYSDDNMNIKKAEKILNEDHYDLEKVKTRILEYLAVKQLKSDSKGPILCFVGPPGVGKTSLGKSIARALGRKFVRISLGGIHDEAEIRGHRRTYVGALPGRIIQELKKSEYSNPVFMLDEIDKLGMDFRGDPSSALLEVLDPEQNFAFNDHYLEVDFDLSNIMFITTAN
ncbi:LON peptidase substrate-binding domain-containing protein, partial [candidate division WOR-3 bacterium]|nr:LON peptidase substrate-binding domain-containing protein [candidate division WOR-3 bacterium]